MSGDSSVISLSGGQLGGPASDFVIVEWTDSGESDWDWIAPLHVHHRDDEAWYVVEGALGFRVGDAVVTARAGGAAIAPGGVAHPFWNAGPAPSRYLIAMTREIKAIIDEAHALQDSRREA